MGHVIGIDTTHTGNPVSFNAAQGGTMKSIVVPFSPTQDLHGYANPWPAGGGANQWDEEWERGTIGLTTGAKADDNTKIRSKNYVPISPNTAYYYKFPGNWRMVYFDADKNIVERGNTYSPNIILTSPATAHYLLFALDATTEYDNNIAINYPSTVTTYSPYANICPISGRTGLSVYRTGKNWYSGGNVTVTNDLFTNVAIDPIPAGTYTVSAVIGTAVTTCRVAFRKQNGSAIEAVNIPYVSGGRSYATITLPDTAYRIYFYYAASTSGTGNQTYTDVQIELGSPATTYEPYSGNTYAVDWSTQAGTVYGGTVDVVTGMLTVDRGRVNVSSSWSWNKSSSYPGGFYAAIENAGTGQKKNTPFICSHAKTATSTSQYVQGTCFCDGSINIRIMGGSDTVQDWQNYINAQSTAGTPIQICYELATPITYQLTPKQIAALIGQNYIWSSNNETLTAVLTAPATGFAGWLIKCVTNGTPVEIPLKYMRAETYTVTPDQRMEWSAERDVTGVLHRETVQNLPPKIEFNTPLMTNSEINALNSIINAAFTNYLQRNITIQFYDPERDQYWEWDCYMPDVKYQIRNADIVNSIINYEELRYAFIGY